MYGFCVEDFFVFTHGSVGGESGRENWDSPLVER